MVSLGARLCGCFVGTVLLFTACHEESVERVPIISLQEERGVSGSFILGTGSLGRHVYYFTYLDFTESGGGYQLEKYAYDRCVIFEDEENSPYVVVELSGLIIERPRDRVNRVEFHVPKGTITRSIKIGEE